MCAVGLETWLGMYTYRRGFVCWLCFDVRSSETHHSYFIVFLESRAITRADSCVFEAETNGMEGLPLLSTRACGNWPMLWASFLSLLSISKRSSKIIVIYLTTTMEERGKRL